MKTKILAEALAAGLSLIGAPAFAGECPADKIRPHTEQAGATMPVGVTDKVLGSIDLSKQYNIPGRVFRVRRLEIKPGGIVPSHSHGERPAHIYVVKGRITEYSSTCAVPIVHKAGDIAVESENLTHWWKNESGATTVLISADILPPAGAPPEGTM